MTAAGTAPLPETPKFTVEFGKDAPPPEDGRLDAAAFHRNHQAIALVLESFLGGSTGDVLEIGSGTGQHAVVFAERWPSIAWCPTDLNDNHLRSIAAWRVHAKLGNVKAPVRLDASAADWRLRSLGLPPQFTAIFCANVIHISPWAVAEGLLAGAARHLAPGGRLFLYGPFKRDGVHTAPSNAAFDDSLRSRNPEWGVRDTAELRALATKNGLRFVELVEMPSNNAILMFEKH
jgi:SAM-dependent methyltransferase